MICGLCSQEQPLGERCSGCGKRLASNAHKCAARLPTLAEVLQSLIALIRLLPVRPFVTLLCCTPGH